MIYFWVIENQMFIVKIKETKSAEKIPSILKYQAYNMGSSAKKIKFSFKQDCYK